MSQIKKRKVGRPRVDSEPITVRLPRDLLSWLDEQRAQLDPVPSRPELIRRLIDQRKAQSTE